MNKELTEKLTSKYFEMFHKDGRGDSKPTMHRNIIYCGDGWFDILWRLCEEIYAMRPKVLQIKEKFGTLRFYASFPEEYTERGWNLIFKAEEESAETCETCGQPGEMRINDGWRSVNCEDCFNKKDDEESDDN